jgi:starch synthase
MARELGILMVAAENDALRNAKVGGIGDVVRDVPPALAALADPVCRVGVVIPAYGFLHKAAGAEPLTPYEFRFGGSVETIEPYRVPAKTPAERVTHFVLHHPSFEWIDPVTGVRRIYCDDPKDTPFATDATKFARFCAAVAEGMKRELFGRVTHLHLHDWHAAFLLLLRQFDAECAHLRELRTVYTIHNLALQGIRPLRGPASSLKAWYPNLKLSASDEVAIRDPDYHNCLNPARVGIRFADKVHAVSPGYREEILRPNIGKRFDPNCEFFGGEGLEPDLQRADAEKRLFGILNGSDYDSRPMPPRDAASYQALLDILVGAVSGWSAKARRPAHDLALTRLEEMRSKPTRPATMVTAVGRLVSQKFRVMQLPATVPALELLLAGLWDDELLVILGTGDADLETFMLRVSCRFKNVLFLNGFDATAANALYAEGDLFLMPSSFEPCGISQMSAMRDGQPCVVHAVGGLKDTVADGVTGFSYDGGDSQAQAENFVRTVFRALKMRRERRAEFDEICDAAFQKRFLWSAAVEKYVEYLYV